MRSIDSRRGVTAGLAVLVVLILLTTALRAPALPLPAMVLAPLVTAAFAGPFATGWMAALAILAAIALGEPLAIFGTVGHLLRVLTVTCGGILATYLARGRVQRDRELSQAGRVGALSRALQIGLLPTPAVRDDRIEVTTRYRPGEHLLLLGGDFYDVVSHPDGTLRFLIGDVAGHGPEAAALGASMRAGWRTLVLTDGGPRSWLEALDHVVELQDDPELFVTVCTGQVDPERGVANVVVAGHPPPLLLGDRAHVLDLKPGPPLGIALGIAEWSVEDVLLGRDWAMLLFTDGLIEGFRAPGSRERYGLESLAAWLSGQPSPAATTPADLDRLLDDIQAANGGPFADDVAVVLLRARG